MRTTARLFLIVMLLAVVSCSHGPRPEETKTSAEQVFIGLASYYGSELSGKVTASGDVYNPTGFTAAHRSLPLGTRVLVTNLENNLSVVVTINDRGPQRADRMVDLSFAAANELKMLASGVVKVRLEVLPEQ